MKIGVIGAGNIGTALAKRLVPRGHEIMLSFSRDPAKLAEIAKTFGASAGTPREAAAFGDVVALTVPWGAVEEALRQAGPLANKLVWDCTNALKADLSGLAIGTTTSGAEIIAGLVPGGKVVKAIPTFAQLMHSDDPTIIGDVFVCSDHADAKAIVTALVEALPMHAVDAGPLENARYVEPASMLLVRLAYGLGRGPRIGLSLVQS